MKKIFFCWTALSFTITLSAGEFEAWPQSNVDAYKQGNETFYGVDASYVNKKKEDKPVWLNGDQWIKNLQTEYRNGKWREFLDDNEVLYEHNAKDYQFGNQIRARSYTKNLTYYYQKLLDKAKKELAEVCSDNSDPVVCNAVSSISYRNKLTSDQIAAIEWLNNLATSDFAAQSQTDENIRKILKEYNLKSFVVYPSSVGFPGENTEKELAVLEFDKFNNLFDVTKNKEENRKINDAYAAFINMAKVQHDLRYLVELGQKTRKPENPTEEKVAVVMSKYVEEIKGLHQK